ncbi:hypothetical protein J2X77_002494 [Sphingobacterium sp. 2149]|nr:hypothetical protein [Sphingobacterium sp. 2149]
MSVVLTVIVDVTDKNLQRRLFCDNQKKMIAKVY